MVSAGETRSNPFAITAAANTVRLDANKTAVTTFTVSNSATRTINGRAQLRSQSPETTGWFSLAGAPERLFAANEAAQYTVTIAVPAGATAGNYVFSIDMVGVENPDELFSQGPPVSLEVTASEVPKKSLPWWWWIPIAAVGALVLAVVAFIVLRPKDDEPLTVAGSRTLVASGPIDVDSPDPVTQPGGKDDLQYVVSGDAHLFAAFNGARIFSTSTGNDGLKLEDCSDAGGNSDVGLVTVPAGKVTSMCVRSNTGATSIVTASLVTRPSNPVTPGGVLNQNSKDKLSKLLTQPPPGIRANELSSIQDLLAGVVRPNPPAQTSNVRLSYSTKEQ